MFRKRSDQPETPQVKAVERVTSVMGSHTVWNGTLSGAGGIRIEGTFEGEVNFQGLLVVGEKGRVISRQVRAQTVIVAGLLRGNIIAQKVEIRSTGKVWGDVVTTAISTQEGAFLRGKITMEDEVDLSIEESGEVSPDAPTIAVEPEVAED